MKKQLAKLKVVYRIILVLYPLRIIKLTNLSRGNSNVLLYKDLLFLKQIGISMRFRLKNDVIVD